MCHNYRVIIISLTHIWLLVIVYIIILVENVWVLGIMPTVWKLSVDFNYHIPEHCYVFATFFVIFVYNTVPSGNNI